MLFPLPCSVMSDKVQCTVNNKYHNYITGTAMGMNLCANKGCRFFECMSLYSPSDVVHAKHKLNNDGRGKVDHSVELKLGQRGLLLVLCFVGKSKTNKTRDNYSVASSDGSGECAQFFTA